MGNSKQIKSSRMKSDQGFALIETLVAMALMGIVAVSMLSGAVTMTRATTISDDQAIALSLVRSEIEYVKNYQYQYSASTYPVDSSIDIPAGWAVPPPVVGLVHATDDGIQSVNVTAERNGEVVLSVEIYQVDR